MNRKTVTVERPPDNYPLKQAVLKMRQAFPRIAKYPFQLKNKNKVLDINKNINDYGIGYQNNNVDIYV